MLPTASRIQGGLWYVRSFTNLGPQEARSAELLGLGEEGGHGFAHGVGQRGGGGCSPGWAARAGRVDADRDGPKEPGCDDLGKAGRQRAADCGEAREKRGRVRPVSRLPCPGDDGGVGEVFVLLGMLLHARTHILCECTCVCARARMRVFAAAMNETLHCTTHRSTRTGKRRC